MHLSVIKRLLKWKGSCVSYLIMELFEEGKFILKRLHLPLQIHSSKSSVIHILQNNDNTIRHSTAVLSTHAQKVHREEVFVFYWVSGPGTMPWSLCGTIRMSADRTTTACIKTWINRGFNTRTVSMLDPCSLSLTHTRIQTFPVQSQQFALSGSAGLLEDFPALMPETKTLSSEPDMPHWAVPQTLTQTRTASREIKLQKELSLVALGNVVQWFLIESLFIIIFIHFCLLFRKFGVGNSFFFFWKKPIIWSKMQLDH